MQVESFLFPAALTSRGVALRGESTGPAAPVLLCTFGPRCATSSRDGPAGTGDILTCQLEHGTNSTVQVSASSPLKTRHHWRASAWVSVLTCRLPCFQGLWSCVTWHVGVGGHSTCTVDYHLCHFVHFFCLESNLV